VGALQRGGLQAADNSSQTSCREGIDWDGKLPHAYEDELQSMGTVDEDQARGTWPVECSPRDVELQVDGMVLDAICSAVPPE
jgi:hypothetical protein